MGSTTAPDPQVSPITHIGFFHYGDHTIPPPQALRRELSKLSQVDCAHALIVLPEAFNAGTNDQYYNRPVRSGPQICKEIRSLGVDNRISFVAGVTITQNPACLPYSAAVLLSPEQEAPISLCNKHGGDGAKAYMACNCNGTSCLKATRHLNIGLAALICMDAYVIAENNNLHNELRRRLAEINGVDYRVLCVPARSTGWTKFIDVRDVYVVLANGEGSLGSFGSFVHYFKESATACRLLDLRNEELRTNRLLVAPLDNAPST